MTRQTYIPVLLVILIAFAGCGTDTEPATEAPTIDTAEKSATATPPARTQTQSPTLTPEPEPDREPPANPSSITSASDVNETALFVAHLAHLDNRDFGPRNFSFQSTYEASVAIASNGSTIAERRVQVNASESIYSRTFMSSERPYDQSYVRNGTDIILRNTPTSGNYPLSGTWYGVLRGSNFTADDSTLSTRLLEVGEELEFQVVQRGYTADGEPRIVLEHQSQQTTYSAALRSLFAADSISAVNFRMAVRPDGRITNASWQIRGPDEGTDLLFTASWTFEYGKSGQVEPAWAASIRGTAQQITVTKANDRTYEVQNTGSLPYPTGTKLTTLFSFGSDSVTIQEELDPGDSVYLAFVNGDFQVVDGPQQRTEYLTLPDRVQVAATIDGMRLASDSSLVD